VTKPFDPMTLGAQIREAWAGTVDMAGRRTHPNSVPPKFGQLSQYFFLN
jgi:hypothetical protein